MPKKLPPDFKWDVVTVARRGDLTVPEVAVDFDVSEESVRRWMRQADIDEGIKDGQTSTEQTETRRAAPGQAPAGERDPAPGRCLLRGLLAPRMSLPLVRDLATEGFPVRLTCGVLGLSNQAYYAWLANPVSGRELDDAYLTNALLDAHSDDPAFGYRFLAAELERAGITVGERRAWRLCSRQRIWSTTVRKGRRGAAKRPGPAVYDDSVQRNYTATSPNLKWLTDI